MNCGTLTTLCLASLLASSTGFAVQPAVRTSPCVAFAGQALPLRVAPSTILADEAAASSDSEGPIKRIRAWFGKYAKVDKATLAKVASTHSSPTVWCLISTPVSPSP